MYLVYNRGHSQVANYNQWYEVNVVRSLAAYNICIHIPTI